MMIVTIVAALAFLVLIGSATMTLGVRLFNLSSRTLAVTFALTAASWLAFLIAVISITVRALALPSA